MAQTVYDIIQSDCRTEDDVFYAYDVLFNGDGTVTRFFSEDEILPCINYILDGLRLLSKSRLHLFNWCPFQFKMSYIVKDKSIIERQIMKDGSNLHLANQLFWNKVTAEDIMNAKDLDRFIYYKYIEVIPDNELERPFIKRMIEEFVSFELNRITGIFNTVGKSLETIKAFVLPVATELAIENWSLNLMGIIDVIYRATNGKLIFVEYKYGKPKNYEISYNHSFINLELGFYSLLVQGKRVYAVVNVDGKDTLVPIQTILGDNVIPYYGAMIFFQDLESSGFLIPITKIMLTNTKKKIAEYKRAINTGKFCEVPKDSCYEWCAHYWEVCKYNPKWLEIKHALDDKPDEEIIDLDEEFDNIIDGRGDMDSDFDPMYE